MDSKNRKETPLAVGTDGDDTEPDTVPLVILPDDADLHDGPARHAEPTAPPAADRSQRPPSTPSAKPERRPVAKPSAPAPSPSPAKPHAKPVAKPRAKPHAQPVAKSSAVPAATPAARAPRAARAGATAVADASPRVVAKRAGKHRHQERAGSERLRSHLEDEIEQELAGAPTSHGATVSLPWLYSGGAILIAGLSAILLIVGWRYYMTPLASRPLHHLHELLRPSGPLALSLGVLGTATMLTSLLYLLRKRLASWTRLGSLRAWMTFHVFTGLVGPTLILFHAAFVPHSAIGLLAFLSMVVVVASGVVGRFIYVAVPVSIDGEELDVRAVRRRLELYQGELGKLGVDERLLRVAAPDRKRREWLWLVHAIVGVVYGDHASRRDYERLRAALDEHRDLTVPKDRALLLARKLSRERQWLFRHRELQKLVGAWRFFHSWLAIVLFVAVAYHIAIALRFGDLWLLPGGER